MKNRNWAGPLRYARYAAVSLMMGVGASVAQARDTIDLSWALLQTLSHNEALQSYPFEQRQAEAMRLQAGLRPLPKLDLMVENALGSGDYAGAEFSETTLFLSQLVELGGKRPGREAVADAELNRLQAEYEVTRLDVLAETSRRYYRLLQVQNHQRRMERRLELEQHSLGIIRQRARAGAVGRADVSKMALRVARSEMRQQQLLDDHALARLRLAAMWQGSAEFRAASGDLGYLPPPPSMARIVAALDQTPAMINRWALERLADARLQLEQSQGRSNVDVGVGLRHLQATSDQVLVFNVSMPLAFKNPNRGRISAAREQRALRAEQTDLARRQLELALREIQTTMQKQRRTAQQIEKELLPLSRTLVQDMQEGYQLGRYSVLEWVDAQAEYFALERAQIDTHVDFYLQYLELERVTGQNLTSPKRENHHD